MRSPRERIPKRASGAAIAMTAQARLPAPVLARVHRRSDARGLLDLLLHWGALVALFAAASALHRWWAYAIAFVLVSGLQNHLIVLAHESWHRKAFASARLNRLVGAWCYGYPLIGPYEADRRRHLAHHRRVGRPEDPDYGDYEREAFRSPSRLLRYLAGLALGSKAAERGLHATGLASGEDSKWQVERREVLRILACQAVLFAGFAWLGRWWEYVLLWALPLATLTSLLVTTRGLLEHVHPDPAAEPAERLYDFASPPAERWFIAPLGFHRHALHHAYPGVPHYRLRALGRALRDHGVSYPGERRPSYAACLRALLRGRPRAAARAS